MLPVSFFQDAADDDAEAKQEMEKLQEKALRDGIVKNKNTTNKTAI